MTIGRDPAEVLIGESNVRVATQESATNQSEEQNTAKNQRAAAYVLALGGQQNLTLIDACTTRLRLTVVDAQQVNEVELKQLGARGVIRPSAHAVQVVVGPEADSLATEIREYLAL